MPDLDVNGLCDCGHAPTPQGCSPGYGTRNSRTACLPCCHKGELADVAAARPGDRFVAYVNGEDGDWRVTDWPGDVLMTRVRWGAAHPFSRWQSDPRRYVSAMDAEHRIWSGVGSPGMYAVLRLTKRVVEFGPAALAKGDPRDRPGSGWRKTLHRQTYVGMRAV